MKLSNVKIKELISSHEIHVRVQKIGKEITEYYRNKSEISGHNPLRVISILKGSVIFFSDLLRAMDLPVKLDFIEVSSYGDEKKSSGIVKILKDFSESIQDSHVLVVEDIIDTGLTLNYLIDNFETRHPISIDIASLLIKRFKTQLRYPVRFTGFEIDDKYIVGYGMDYKGLFRNNPNIGYLTGPIEDRE